ncbi:hypothetical protein O3M35_000092 [Rhynocoris fuscipes]|uniref:RING-type domain-containing protein n=1 Tax=Rhynocoris fuscipes TaxID=488301 RepID=A0AAW1DNY9_9HEMI
MRKSSASDSPDNRRIVNEHASDCPDENENGSPDNKAKGSRRKLESSTSTDSHAVSGPSRRNIDLDAGDSSKRGDGANRCIICLKCLYPSKARPSTCSSHYFHATCLKKWSKTSNTCPFCRVEYKNIFIENKNGVLIKRHTVVTPPPQNDNAEQDVPADDFSETDENSLYSDEEDCIRCQVPNSYGP